MFWIKAVLFAALLSALTNFAFAQQSKSDLPYESVAPKKNERCIVCGVELTDDDIVLIVKGRRVPLNYAMVDSFLNNPAKFFKKLQPKGSLFQENIEAKAGAAQGGVSFGWFLLGAYVLSALIFGGFSGYVAISKGVAAIPNFFIGFFLSVIGFVYVLTRPAVAKKGEIPKGLVKVPTTHTPVHCPKCGAENHPSGAKCSGCGADMKPLVESEVRRV